MVSPPAVWAAAKTAEARVTAREASIFGLLMGWELFDEEGVAKGVVRVPREVLKRL